MAIHTGFFDAAFNEETGTYDREYGSEDFTGYFGEIVGSGVCVHGGEVSMQVYYDSASKRAVVNPGYLFIRGYWLKNDGLYTVSLDGLADGTYAICAQLHLGSRSVTIGQMQKANPEVYPDALVLAYVTLGGGAVTVEDTRGRTDICGLLDSAGSLSSKIAYAVNYIDNEIQGRLDRIEQGLRQQKTAIAGKIDEASSLISQIAPPAVGTIKFSAAQNIEEGWLLCDGSFINEARYPELVQALGKLTPSGDKFKLLSDGEIAPGITNGVIYNDKMWVYSWSARKLFGVDLHGERPVKVISVVSADPDFDEFINPLNGPPLALSIVNGYSEGYKLFLVQIISSTKWICLSADMTDSSDTITIAAAYENSIAQSGLSIYAIPYVISQQSSGTIEYYLCVGKEADASGTYFKIAKISNKQLSFTHSSHQPSGSRYGGSTVTAGLYAAYSPKNQNELLAFVEERSSSGTSSYIRAVSYNNGLFSTDGASINPDGVALYPSPVAMPIAGVSRILLQTNLQKQAILKYDRLPQLRITEQKLSDIALPSMARVFRDSSVYLWGKDMFFIFVGTGIIFSRTLEEGSFGYLDTTSVLGAITQGGYLDYAQDEGILYIIGQDSANRVKAAKIVLNTLYDYANDGAWLPLIAADGVPAYIKAQS